VLLHTTKLKIPTTPQYESIHIYRGITNFGIRPTVSDTRQCSLETHILDFDEDIYGEEITVEFLKMIRPEKKFASIHDLKEQISKDISMI